MEMRGGKKLYIALFVFVIIGITVFLILKKKKIAPEIPPAVVQHQNDSVFSSIISSEFYNFETIDLGATASDKAFSGKRSTQVNSDIEYGFGIHKKIKDFPVLKDAEKVFIELMAFNSKADSSVFFVYAVTNSKNENLHWESRPIVVAKQNEWNANQFTFDIKPELLSLENNFSFYVWNRDKKEVIIDDLTFSLYGKALYNKISSVGKATNYFYDFETTNGIEGSESIKNCTAHSGKMACDLSDGKEYGISIIKSIKDISDLALNKISLSVWYYPLEENANTVLTVSVVNSNKETVFWEGKSTDTSPFPKNTWTKLNASFFLPTDKIGVEDKIHVNIWNKGKNKIIADDLEIVYGEQPERKGVANPTDPNIYADNKFVPVKNKPPFQVLYFQNKNINTSVFKNFAASDQFYAGDFIKDKSNLDELLYINNNRIQLYRYNAEKKEFDLVVDGNELSDSIKNQLLTCKLFIADFDNNGSCDILAVNKKNAEAKLFSYAGNTLKSINKTFKIEKKWLNNLDKINVTTNFSENRRSALTFIDGSKLLLLSLSSNGFAEKEIILSASGMDVLGKSDKLYSGSFTSATENEFLKLNTDWRFDLKLVRFSKNDYTINYSVDFKGYENDYNPKYYELTKIVVGKFLDKNKDALFVVSCNCKDVDFDGQNCKMIESLKELPNAINIYAADEK
jgi:hypothetical protein